MATAIPTRPFGNTGIEVTQVSLGSVFVGEWAGTQRADGLGVVAAALDEGVNYIDSAPFYGNAQKLIGEVIQERPHNFILGTKCGRWDFRSGPFRQLDAFKQQFEQTLRDYHRDSVDLIYIHEADWYVYWEDVAAPREKPYIDPQKQYNYASAPVLEFLQWLKDQKLTRFVGISGNNADLLAKVLGELPISVDAVLVAYQYSLIWRNAVEYLFPVARKTETALVIGTPFQGGRLAEPHPEWLTEPPAWMDDDTRERYAALYDIQRESGLSLAELGLRFLLTDPEIACVIPGAATVAQLEENVRCASAGPLPDDIYQKLAGLGKIFPNRY